MLTIKAHAKINLALDVLGKRADGYHEVAMIMQSIDLADTLYLSERDTGITIATDHADLMCNQTNLAYRAADLLCNTYGLKKGVHIRLEKRIPIAAGLAGGSADAAGVFVGLNHLWNLNLTLDELTQLGARLGSDIPFCIRGGTMLAEGRGEKLSALPDIPECYAVLAKPKVDVSTAWVYQNYKETKVKKHPDIDGMIKCLKQDDLEGIGQRLCNVLESVTIPVYPEVGELKICMQEAGLMASLMSGSGPTVFGLTADAGQAQVAAAMLKSRSDARIMVAKVGGENGTAIITNSIR